MLVLSEELRKDMLEQLVIVVIGIGLVMGVTLVRKWILK